MNKSFGAPRLPSLRRESGAVLVVGLVMVLLMSIIGLSAIRGSNLQESMAGNMRERNVAFQASESALRIGEALVSDQVSRPLMTNNQGLYNDTYTTPTTSILTFTEVNWKDAAKVRVTALSLEHVSREPTYIVEQLDPDIGIGAAMEGSAIDLEGMQNTGDITPYRVTARGFGASENSVKTLQTTYNRRYFQ
jgi:type IV pilus assembly protein PilX